MTSLQAQARSLYRALHRELILQSQPAPHLALSIPPNPTFHKHLRQVFSKKESVPEKRIVEGRDILLFLRSQRTYKALLERYNPSVGMEQDEKVRRTARRVGLELPVELRARIEGEDDIPGKKDS